MPKQVHSVQSEIFMQTETSGWDFLLRQIPTQQNKKADENKRQSKVPDVHSKRKSFSKHKRKNSSPQYTYQEAEERMMNFLRDFRQSQGDSSQNWSSNFTKVAKEFLFGGVPEFAPRIFYAYEKLFKANALEKQNSPPNLDRGLVLTAIRGHYECGDIDGGNTLYETSLRDGCQFDSQSKALIICSLCKGGTDGLHLAFNMKEEMKQNHERLTARAFDSLLEALWRNAEVAIDTEIVNNLPKQYIIKRNSVLALSLLKRSENIYNDLLKENLRPTDQIQAHLLRCAFRSAFINAIGSFVTIDANNLQRAGKMAMRAANDIIQRHNITVDFSVTTTMLEECININYAQGAEHTLGLMRRNNLWARTSTFNTLLGYFRSQKDIDGALAVFNSLESCKTVVPNNETFILILQTCAASGKCVQQTLDVIKQATIAKVANSKAFWDERVNVEYLSGVPVLTILKRMEDSGFRPNEGTVECFINACAERGDTEAAFNLLNTLKQKESAHMFPRLVSALSIYRSLLECCQKTQSYQRALDLLQQMCKSKNPRPDLDFFQKVIEICVNSNRLDEAIRTFTLMEAEGYQSNQKVLSSLIRGFGRRLDLGSALGVWDELCHLPTRPSRSSYETIIDACISHPQGLGHVCKLIRDMQKEGYELGSAQYNLLVKGFGRAESMENALESFRNIDFGIEVNEATLAGLVDACQRSGESDSIQEAMAFLYSMGIVPPKHIMAYIEKDKGKSDLYKRFFKDEIKAKIVSKVQLEREKKILQHGRIPIKIQQGLLAKQELDEELQGHCYSQFSQLLDAHFKNSEQDQFEQAKVPNTEQGTSKVNDPALWPRIIEIKSSTERKQERIQKEMAKQRAENRKKKQVLLGSGTNT